MTQHRILAGASGYSFKEWKGTFYPDKIKPEAMLAFYAEQLPTVEINNTFYAMPKATVLENWVARTPDTFCFAIKAPKLITHQAKLRVDAAGDAVAYLYKTLAMLGDKRGPVLFQLPPYVKKSVALLSEFLALLPADHRAAFEFRDESWFDETVYEVLRKAGASLCLSEREDNAPPPLVETAPWGYVRLRLEEYSERDLKRWAERLLETRWKQIHVFFMHEPTAPAYAQSLMKFAKAG